MKIGIDRLLDENERLRATIQACIIAMRCCQESKYPTDWKQMIAGLEATLANEQNGDGNA